MAHEIARRCRFLTDRLIVEEWHRLGDRCGLDLVEVVERVLTAATTGALPIEWRGDFERGRAEAWIQTRDAESPTLLVVEKRSGHAIGLMILFEIASEMERPSIDLRLGYVLAASSWGQGFATELVDGLVRWAASEPAVGSISGGVARDNLGSARVLLKNGFSLTSEAAEEQIYRLDVQ